MTGSFCNPRDVSIYACFMAERLERESCDCKTCVWSMGPGCWSVESYLLTPPLNQVKNASSSFFSLFFCMFPFLKDPWILEILKLTAQGRALLWNSPPHSLPTDLLRWEFCTKILKRVAEYVLLTIFISILSSSWYRNPTCSSTTIKWPIWSCWTTAFTTTSTNHLSTGCHAYVR